VIYGIRENEKSFGLSSKDFSFKYFELTEVLANFTAVNQIATYLNVS